MAPARDSADDAGRRCHCPVRRSRKTLAPAFPPELLSAFHNLEPSARDVYGPDYPQPKANIPQDTSHVFFIFIFNICKGGHRWWESDQGRDMDRGLALTNQLGPPLPLVERFHTTPRPTTRAGPPPNLTHDHRSA
eukprot:scaffold4010_cov104-Isochrysis_galbana.AAC.1